MGDFKLGMDAKIYVGASGSPIHDLIEMDNVKDVTLNLTTGEADVTTRANSGWRATASTLKECTVDFEMLWKTADAGFVFIRDAFLTSDQVRLAVLTDAWWEVGAEGVIADFSITQFNRSEPLEDGIKVAVTAKLAAVSTEGSVDDGWYGPVETGTGTATETGT